MYLFSLQLKGIHSDKTFIIRAYGSTMLSSIIDTDCLSQLRLQELYQIWLYSKYSLQLIY